MSRTLSRSCLPLALLAVLAAAPAGPAHAQARPPEVMNAAEIQLALAKLRVVGSVLYVAAHPDDENTALLAYLSRERKVRTGYLAATRGDGGQNLLGTETGSLLGVIRTQELLAARRIDGAEQFFTRALDFGFSKNPEETLRLWGHDSVLSDMVWVIRTFRPDVIITRFPTTGEGGHGHHTASAILAGEAFEAAADPARFPEQLRFTSPWRARRLFWNAFRMGPAERPDPREARFLTLDLGAYNSLLGKSYSEIAADSRSQHKSQGFGSAERRGRIPNYFYPLAGDTAGVRDILGGLDLTWAREPGGAAVDALLAEAQRSLDPARPAGILPLLLRAHAALERLPADALVETKRRELLELIRSCAGMWLEAIAAEPEVPPGRELKVTVTALNRSDFPLRLERVENAATGAAFGPPPGGPERGAAGAALAFNQPVQVAGAVRVPASADDSQPYWLRLPPGIGLFHVADPRLIGRPENPPAVALRAVLSAAGDTLRYELPVVYRWTHPVAGERYRPLEVVPRATLRLDRGVYVFPDPRPRPVSVVARDGGAGAAGRVSLRLPAGWQAEPAFVEVRLSKASPEQECRFLVTPGPGPASGTLGAVLEDSVGAVDRSRVVVDYPHIPVEVLFPPAESPFVRLELRKAGETVGYLMGSGDEIPEVLGQLGYRVSLLSDEEVEESDLSRFDAIVAGVRAYNTRPRLRLLQPRLLAYVKAGGTLLVQYDTADSALDDRLGPYPFRITHDRVTVEEAPVSFLLPGHPLLTQPNRIEASDFDGWVQERGLYFANPWDPKYETPLACHDPGEPDRPGGLLYARYGKGVFLYSAYAWFRQLPAGVPGALKLFVNQVSAGRAGS
ncbi:MAG TPA: PIG-L family deacetylase [Candidatus Saccharimonadales bacterium]|nr:PIG-L family deacetylase [Candidatus Saccharimonadales bacterium]